MRLNVLAKLGFSIALAMCATHARAAVTEPNGVTVPATSSTSTETSLQQYFDAQSENIDASAAASTEPGVFSPLCDFTATLVLSEAGSAAGLAWYNVPATPNAAPAELFQILPESSNVTGAMVAATDIRANPKYQGGLIGFALTKFGGTPVYYSEYQRNVNCTGCVMPGYWKMMLAYRSNVHASSYYIAFEDWEGADEQQWFGNDGDFNDKVFLVTGVSCPGGGEPCDTGKKGLCAAGLTECSFNGAPQCKQQYEESAEKCDNVDNDCNGAVDDGDLCAQSEVCWRGRCVEKCNTGEFKCPDDLVCNEAGVCIEAPCVNVACPAGLSCRAGRCVGSCQGVVCPSGQVCESDRCVDPCANVVCPMGTLCERGVCVGDCTCNGCAQGKVCSPTGRCVQPGCESVTCSSGQVCDGAQCVDACKDAICPLAGACLGGQCQEPVVSSGGVAGGGMAGAGGVVIEHGSSGAGAGGLVIAPMSSGGGGLGGNAGTPGSGGTPDAWQPANNGAAKSGCGCRVATAADKSVAPGALASLLFALALRRRSRATREPSRARRAS